MIVIVGCIVVIGAVLGGFMLAGGHIGALIHPAEFLTIGGAALGGLIVSSPKKVLVDLMKGMISTLKGTPYNRAAYDELFKCLYDLLRMARRDGMLVLEGARRRSGRQHHLHQVSEDRHDHHVTAFICGAMAPLIESTAKPEQLAELLGNGNQDSWKKNTTPRCTALQKMADALPGFGIVAAVLGIVITMGHIDGRRRKSATRWVRRSWARSWGFWRRTALSAPLATRLEFLGHSEIGFFRTIAAIIVGFANNLPPKVAIDLARRGVASEFRADAQRAG